MRTISGIETIAAHYQEMTRIGAVVNDIRKKVTHSAPELSKRCRILIKCWQKLAEPKPASSSSSSTNGTPSYASSLVIKGLTPVTPARGARVTPSNSSRLTASGNSRLTPVNSHLTSSGSSSAQSCVTSLATLNGRAVVPCQRLRQDISSNALECESMQKAYTVGSDLAMKAVENSLSSCGEMIRNGKRRFDHSGSSDIESVNETYGAPLFVQKICKRLCYNSPPVSPAVPHQSLLAARRADVKSTSELVAQLTENLPGYLSFDIPRTRDLLDNLVETSEEKQPVSPCIGHLWRTPVLSSLQAEVNRKEKRIPLRNDFSENKESVGRSRFIGDDEAEIINSARQTTENGDFVTDDAQSCSEAFNPDKVRAPLSNGKYDWYAMLPALETLRNREHIRAKVSEDPRRSYIINVRGREVLVLPYIDIGLPDFLEYGYPEPARFYSDVSVIHGASRPS
ncbi:unnamed protein product [Thelazia callipaeda]|uniref:TFIIS N-terminal domain-containing protein n=1 Tax=Thelazia callipaeda TaxID=103827 RepID=A0A0N5CM96_THECL|nr:unnamed protein product [Thelazia callipaeda]